MSFRNLGNKIMKSRWSQLFDKSLAAIVAAIEVYNKPDFQYREETFAVLAINSWELALKSYWLREHGNKMSSLYVHERRENKDGTLGRRKVAKKTRSGNPFTHSLEFLLNQLHSNGELPLEVVSNLNAMIEIRDSATHFYNQSPLFAKRLQEVGMGCLKNYVEIAKSWFDFELSEYNFYLMPLSFLSAPSKMEGIPLNKEEVNIVSYIDSIDNSDPDGTYAVTVNVNIGFVRSKAKDALKIQIVRNDDDALKVELTEEQIRERYKWDYKQLNDRCRERYLDFKINPQYHSLRKQIIPDERFCNTRYLDPGNPKSGKKDFYDPNVLQFFDRHYTKA